MNAKPLLLSALILGMAGELVSQAQINHTRPYGSLGFSVDNPVLGIAQPLAPLSSSKRMSHQFPRLDFGLSLHYLVASEYLEKDFTGVGLNLTCHLNRHVALLYQRQYCLLTALDPDYWQTPFSQARRIMNQRLLRLSFRLFGQTFFLHSGFTFIERSSVGIGLIYGIGYGLPLPAHFLIITSVEHRQFGGRYSSFDEHTEVKLEIAYSILERGRSAPHLLGEPNAPQGLMKPPWIDVGLNTNLLLKSERFRYGYSGMGLSLSLYVYKRFAIVYRHQFRNMNSKDSTDFYTPFQHLQTPVQVYLLRFPVYFNSDAFFLQFGTVYHRKSRPDNDGEGGLVGGIGYRWPLNNRLSLSVYLENRWLGSFSIGGGHTYDEYREFGLELTASLPYPVQ